MYRFWDLERFFCIGTYCVYVVSLHIDSTESMIQWGKVWEIWSRAVPSGGGRPDAWSAVPHEESRCPVLYCPSKGWMSECSQGRQSILFVVHNATGILTVGHRLSCVYLLSTWHHHTWPDLPGLPPLYFILEAIKYWGGNGLGTRLGFTTLNQMLRSCFLKNCTLAI